MAPSGFIPSSHKEIQGILRAIELKAMSDVTLPDLALNDYSSQDVLHLVIGRGGETKIGPFYSLLASETLQSLQAVS